MSSKVQNLMDKAQAGDVPVQMALARRYKLGQGVAQSDENALEWNLKAAEQGDKDAKKALKNWSAAEKRKK